MAKRMVPFLIEIDQRNVQAAPVQNTVCVKTPLLVIDQKIPLETTFQPHTSYHSTFLIY